MDYVSSGSGMDKLGVVLVVAVVVAWMILAIYLYPEKNPEPCSMDLLLYVAGSFGIIMAVVGMFLVGYRYRKGVLGWTIVFLVFTIFWVLYLLSCRTGCSEEKCC